MPTRKIDVGNGYQIQFNCTRTSVEETLRGKIFKDDKEVGSCYSFFTGVDEFHKVTPQSVVIDFQKMVDDEDPTDRKIASKIIHRERLIVEVAESAENHLHFSGEGLTLRSYILLELGEGRYYELISRKELDRLRSSH